MADLEAVLTQRPRDAQAWLTRAFILLALGRPRSALRSCAPLWGFAGSLVSKACAAAAAGRMGRAEAAFGMLDRELKSTASLDSPADPSLLVWALSIQAELAVRLSRPETADALFTRALSLGVRDVQLLAAYGDFLLDMGRAAQARELLLGETASDGLLLRLTLSEQALGDPDYPANLATLEARMAAARRRGDRLHLRDTARVHLHLLDEPSTALELALDNWSVQREPADASIVLEAAAASGQPAAARPVLDWMAATSLNDPRLADLARLLEGGPEARRQHAQR